ncbi:MAG: glucosamine-6-phosphate deaminase [Planctomycetota bacterium]
MSEKQPAELSPVERAALEWSPYADIYPPAEKMRTIVVENFPALGRLAAMRFLEWVQGHPEGVVSLPTGKTPEYFIKWVQRLLGNWDEPETQAELERAGLDPSRRPEMGGLRFVQIDEFYPIDPRQENSFHHYVRQFYVEGFGLDPDRAMLMDCSKIGLLKGQTIEEVWPDKRVDLSLRYRAPEDEIERRQKRALMRVDQWCQRYEERVREMGGIGFFLGGIGPDGHVGFNVRGSDHHSTTRLTETNYETQAAAAVDLGGVEIARDRLVITIGLGTITYRTDCTALIMAAGHAKAGVVADAVQREPHVRYPATALQALPGARFYVTPGAARRLEERQLEALQRREEVKDEDAERIVIDLALNEAERVEDLDEEQFGADRFAAALLERRPEPARKLARAVADKLTERIDRGAHTLSDTRFLHTEPHHDDIMLGYLPYVVRHVRSASNTHYFATMTSGFTSVSNRFMLRRLDRLSAVLDSPEFAAMMEAGYFDPENRTARNRDVWQYLDGVAADDADVREEGAARRLLRDLGEVFESEDLDALRNRVEELRHYFRTQYPGKKDPPHIQRLKGMCREWEVECLWGYFGWQTSNIMHLRLGFYTGDIFTEEPTPERDVLPILRTLRQVRPDVVTVALDPEGSGPDTHYKVLQAITQALRRYEQESGRSDLRIWGYRNVWYRFHPAEADICVPVSLNMFAVARSAFMNSFASQRQASFPSYEHDGPFNELAQKIQVEQYQKLKTCLGREWFHEHDSPLIRATRGLVFLKELTLQQLYERSRALRRATEDR